MSGLQITITALYIAIWAVGLGLAGMFARWLTNALHARWSDPVGDFDYGERHSDYSGE